MALILADRVRETSTTTGTGALSLAGAVVGYQTFSSAIGNTNTCYYAISNPGVAEWEVGIGTYATSGNTLTRTTILKSSNSNAAVNFSAGTKDVFVTYPATKSVYLDASGNVTLAGTLTANTIGAFTLGGTVAGGGNQLNNVIIGTTTPLAGAFTTLSASGDVSANNGLSYITGVTSPSSAASGKVMELVVDSDRVDMGGTFRSTIISFDRTNTVYGDLNIQGLSVGIAPSGTIRGLFTSTGLAVTGTLSATGAASVDTTAGAGTTHTGLTVGSLANSTNSTITRMLVVGRIAGGDGEYASIRLNQSTDLGAGYAGIVARRESNNNGVSLDFTVNGTGTAATPLTALTLSYTGAASLVNGLAVTGALSATGLISSTGGNTNAMAFTGATTNYQYISMANTTANMTLGVERSTGGGLIVGSTGYDVALSNSGGGISFGVTGNALGMRLSSTGLAVTGTLTSTVAAAGAFTTLNASIGTFTSSIVSQGNAAPGSGTGLEMGYNPGGAGSGYVLAYNRSTPGYKALVLNDTVTITNGTGLAVTGTLSTTGEFTTTGGSNVQTSWTLQESGTRSLVLKNPTNVLAASVGTGTNHDLQVEGSQVYIQVGSFGSRSTAATFTSTGNLGIGTSSPAANLNIFAANTVTNSNGNLYVQTSTTAGTDVGGQISLGGYHNGTSSSTPFASIAGRKENATAGNQAGYLAFSTDTSGGTNTERARIDSSGNFLVGTTSYSSGASSAKMVVGFDGLVGNGFKALNTNASAGTDVSFVFVRDVSVVGSITTTLSATAYNTSSDYRLKENVQPMTGALATVAALKPVTFNWKLDGSDGQGFIAHELQSVVPDCVTGEKDAVEMQTYEISPASPATFDEEGNEVTAAVEAVMGEREVPRYQGIDTSFLVATLTAALQEAHGLIKDLTTRITALEAK